MHVQECNQSTDALISCFCGAQVQCLRGRSKSLRQILTLEETSPQMQYPPLLKQQQNGEEWEGELKNEVSELLMVGFWLGGVSRNKEFITYVFVE